MKGEITRLILDRGFGFIRDDQDDDRFFHANDLRGCDIDDLDVGDEVEFEPAESARGGDNGLRAKKVRRA